MYPQVRTEFDRRRRYLFYADVLEVLGWDGLAKVFALGLSDERLNTASAVEFMRWEREVLERNLTAESVHKILEAIGYADVSSSLAKLGDIQVLLLAGDSGPLGVDQPITQRRIDEIRSVIPGVEVCTIRGTGGTYCMLEKPEESTDAACRFFRRVVARGKTLDA
jgi:hypothetical protein